MIYTEEELRAAGYKEVRIEPTSAKFENISTGEIFEPIQIETFKDRSDKVLVFYSRPGDDDNSRYSLESLKINFREVSYPATEAARFME